MPKYRLLTNEELTELKEEFINYLIVNGIHADDWSKMLSEDTEEAQGIVDLFSDVVFESIMRKTNYLEFRSANDLKVFQCLAEEIVLVGVRTHQIDVNFEDPEFLKAAIENPPEGLEVYTSTKKYRKERELELFEMIEAGCTIGGEELFKSLCVAL